MKRYTILILCGIILMSVFMVGCGQKGVPEESIRETILKEDIENIKTTDLKIKSMDTLVNTKEDNKIHVKCRIEASNDELNYAATYKIVYEDNGNKLELVKFEVAKPEWNLKKAQIEVDDKKLENYLEKNSIEFDSYSISEPNVDLKNNKVTYEVRTEVEIGNLQKRENCILITYTYLSPQEGWDDGVYTSEYRDEIVWNEEALCGKWHLYCGALSEVNCYSDLYINDIDQDTNTIYFTYEHYFLDENGEKYDVVKTEGDYSVTNGCRFEDEKVSERVLIDIDAYDIWSGQLAYEKES